jgi:Uma2 family endonuclease
LKKGTFTAALSVPGDPPGSILLEDVMGASSIDQRVFLRDMSWSQFEVFLEIRGDAPVPRIAYRDGELELMTPSQGHELTKTTLGRLIEAYADEMEMGLWGYGSWTLKSAPEETAAEPDECYCIGGPPTKDAPDLAIEVVWTRGGLDKLEIYRRLGVAEVWFWENQRITVHKLKGNAYKTATRSGVFPELDLDLVGRLAAHPDPSQAVRELRAWVRGKR